MSNILHRLSVRKIILEALTADFPGTTVISREAGHIDVTVPADADTTTNKLKAKINRIAASNGFSVDWLVTPARTRGEPFNVSFTNDTMQRQHLWGARGNNKRWRAQNGVTDQGSEPTPLLAGRTTEQMAGEVEDAPGGDAANWNETDAAAAEDFAQEAAEG